MKSLLVYPPYVLAKWIPAEERPKHIYKIEFYGSIDENLWTADIDLILTRKTINASFGALSANMSYIIGCTEITLSIYGENECVLKGFTKSKIIKGKYIQNLQVNQNGSFTIEPALSIGEASGKLLSYQSGQGKQFTHTVEFECEERVLAERHETSGIEWTLKKPPHQDLIRNYMYGNILLNATFEWVGSKAGTITITPNDIGVFNVSNNHIGKRASLLTEYFLFLKGHRVANRKGVTFKFAIK